MRSLADPMFDIGPPFSDEGSHIFRQFAFEKQLFPGDRVDKADGLGVQGMPGANSEAIVDELPVLGKHGSLYDLIAAVGVVVKQRMPDMLHMNADLVGAARFQDALYQGNITETFQYFIVGNGFFSVLAFGVGIAVGAAINNSCCSWGYSYWGTNWHGGTVVYRSTVYHGNNAWRGGAYGSSVAAYGPYGSASAGRAYNPSTGTYARGASVSTPYGTRSAGQAYNPSTGSSARAVSGSGPNGTAMAASGYNASTGTAAATRQGANAYGTAGSSVVSRNGETAYTQHQTTAQGTVATGETSAGGRAIAASGAEGNNAAAAETAGGTKYAAANGNVYKNSGSGWQQTRGTPNAPVGASASSPAARGWGQDRGNVGSSALSSGGGWQSRAQSARGAASRGGFRRR